MRVKNWFSDAAAGLDANFQSGLSYETVWVVEPASVAVASVVFGKLCDKNLQLNQPVPAPYCGRVVCKCERSFYCIWRIFCASFE